MKKIKIAFTVIILALIAFFVWQNWHSFFNHQHSLSLDLHFGNHQYKSDKLPLWFFLAIAFVFGALGSYFSSLKTRFSNKKQIKELSAKIDALTSELEKQKADQMTAFPDPLCSVEEKTEKPEEGEDDSD